MGRWIRMNSGGAAAGFVLGLAVLLAACSKSSPIAPDAPVIPDEYTVDVFCLDLTGLDGMSFVDRLPVDDAELLVDGEKLESERFTSEGPGHFRFTHRGETVRLDFTGGVHDAVLHIRYPNSDSNFQQVTGGAAAVHFPSLEQGNAITLLLYKIPSWVNMDWVRQALPDGTAVYTNNPVVYLTNDEYSDAEWAALKPGVVNRIQAALDRINPCLNGISASLHPDARGGNIRVHLGKSADYTQPGCGTKDVNGILEQGTIRISAVPADAGMYLEMLYRALGVRHAIMRSGSDRRLSDEISDGTGNLNRFGKALMRINYFLRNGTLF